MNADTIRTLGDMIHTHGVIPSLTALGDLMLDRATRANESLSEADELEAIKVSEIVDHVGPEILVLRKVRAFDGRPTVLVSLRRFPEAHLGFVLDHLAPLRKLGAIHERRDALEMGVARELQIQLPSNITVTLLSDELHEQCNDIVVVGPKEQVFNIETRNWRSGVHDQLKPVDKAALERDYRAGVTTIFVVPRCTQQFRRAVDELGGIVIETKTYLVSTPEQRDALARFSWMCRSVELSSKASPRIAGQIASVILDSGGTKKTDAPSDGRPMNSLAAFLNERITRSESDPGKSAGRSKRRIDQAEGLAKSGITTMQEAADLLGCSRRTLLRDYRKWSRMSPWPRGGARR